MSKKSKLTKLFKKNYFQGEKTPKLLVFTGETAVKAHLFSDRRRQSRTTGSPQGITPGYIFWNQAEDNIAQHSQA